ncbi:MAG: hypothetical protein QM503_11865 [Bacteroidota bacterium]
MIKKVLISTSLAYYLIFMVLPNLPFVQYYYGQYKHNYNEQVISNNDSKVLIGDICFLQALVERTKEISDTKETEVPPKPNNRTVNLIYLLTDYTNLDNLNNYQDFKFHDHVELLTFRYLQIPSPPPKFL